MNVSDVNFIGKWLSKSPISGQNKNFLSLNEGEALLSFMQLNDKQDEIRVIFSLLNGVLLEEHILQVAVTTKFQSQDVQLRQVLENKEMTQIFSIYGNVQTIKCNGNLLVNFFDLNNKPVSISQENMRDFKVTVSFVS